MAGAALPGRLTGRAPLRWHVATVRETAPENPRARTLRLEVPSWPGHRAGQHVDVRLTAEDGYQAQRSYSIASAPETPGVDLTVELIEDGEVSPYLVEEVRAGDAFEVRGPIGGPFTWSVGDGGPLLLLAGGSGLVPLMAMLRHRAAQGAAGLAVDARILISVRTEDDRFYAGELEALRLRGAVDVRHTLTRAPAREAHDFTGRLDDAMLAVVDPGAAARPRVFICGANGFVEHAAALLLAAGHDPARIATERFGPS